jgi:hypothetical protein
MKPANMIFDNYIQQNKEINLHPKILKLYKNIPKNVYDFKNLIIYGPPGVGKYTQMLSIIKLYSPSNLKYEKKLIVTYNKNTYFFKISDIHFEIDMSLLGCQSKMLWNEVYNQILDIISSKQEKIGIIVCKYFNKIHNELLETFYSYMQSINLNTIILKFILITEELSFIGDNILNSCQLISISRPTKTQYSKCINNKINKDIELEEISNIKNLKSTSKVLHSLMIPHKIICDNIIEQIVNINILKYNYFRDLLYEILIYDLDINDCIWYIITNLINKKLISDNDMPDLLIKIYLFFQYYNNNYRPIYHLENLMLYIINKIHNKILNK